MNLKPELRMMAKNVRMMLMTIQFIPDARVRTHFGEENLSRSPMIERPTAVPHSGHDASGNSVLRL